MDSKKQAQGIASLGRYGDTTLMHMRPDEVEQLTAISRANGGDITINPETGMPEAFLGNFFSALAPMAAGAAANYFIPGSGFVAQYAAPFAAGAATKAIQGETDPMSLVMGGVGGVGGAGLGKTIRGYGAQDLAGTAAQGLDDAASVGVDAAVDKGVVPGTDMTKAYATNVPQMSGTQGVSMYTPQGYTPGYVPSSNLSTIGPQGTTGIQPTNVYDQGLTPNFTPDRTGAIGSPYPRFDAGGFEPTSAVAEPRGFLTDATDNLKKGIRSITEEIGTTAKRAGEEYSAAGERLGREGFGDYLSYAGDGDKFIGGIKTGLPFAGAGYEAYQRSLYEGLPTYESSTAGKYDPSRVLNLGMDTGLRLLAKGGEVKKFNVGGLNTGPVTVNPYSPFYQQPTTVQPHSPFYQPPEGRGPAPEYGIVDVGGNFVKTSDEPGKGLMSKTDYYETYKFKEPGYTPEKQDEDSGGDMEAINKGAQAGMSINPAVALDLAQGYAESQQSGLEEQGLGQLRKGGAVKYQQGGKTTAEANTAKVSTPPPVGAIEMVLAKKQMEEQGIPAGINVEAIKAQAANAGMNEGGIAQLAQATPDDGKMLNGEGDGVSDDIPAMIEGEQEAALSDGEFIVPARIVSELGNGSSDAGAQKLYEMIDRIQAVRKQTMGDDKQYAKDTNAERYLPA